MPDDWKQIGEVAREITADRQALRAALSDDRARRDTREQHRITEQLRQATHAALKRDAKMKMVNIADIRINGGTQSRAGINREVVADYAEAIRGGAEFPPVVLFFDGSAYWLADGFHRYEAHAEAGAHEVAADVRQGTQRDAILYSVGANATHGLRRTNEDKRRAVMVLLNDPEWSEWSANRIAKQCGVSDKTVARIKAEHLRNSEDSGVRIVERGGTVYQQNTANIGGGSNAGQEKPAAQGPEKQAEASAPAAGVPDQEAAEPAPEPEAPADPHADERKKLAKLTREALEDDVIGLREALADERKRRKEAEQERDRFKADLADLAGAGQQAEVIRRLSRKIEHLRSQMFRANEDARIAVRQRRKAEDARDEALRKLGEQIIPLEY